MSEDTVSKAPGDGVPSTGLWGIKRLTDDLTGAFLHACNEGDTEVAQRLVIVMEFALQRSHLDDVRDLRYINRFRNSLIAAHERLWVLRHPELA